MEVSSVHLVFELCRLYVVFESSEVILGELRLSEGLETLVQRWLLAFVVLLVNSCASRLCERLAKKVL